MPAIPEMNMHDRGIIMCVGFHAEAVTEMELRHAQLSLIHGQLTERDKELLDAVVSHSIKHCINWAKSSEAA